MHRALLVLLIALIALPAAASHLVTGNGYGFAVVAPESASITKFYAHPYSFMRPDPKNPLAEGIETTNFITSIGWQLPDGSANLLQNPSAEYDSDSHIIRIHSSLGSGLAYMPFDLNQNALILSWQPSPSLPTNTKTPNSTVIIKWAHTVASEQFLPNTSVQLITFIDVSESILLIPLAPNSPTDPRPANFPDHSNQPFIGNAAFALISIDSGTDPAAVLQNFLLWRGNLTPDELAKHELDELEKWRVDPEKLNSATQQTQVHFKSDAERHLWRQSEVMLRIAQSREANTPTRHGNGLIVAALPDGVYFTPWVRDMAYATLALIRMGHQAEARAAILAYFNAQPTGKMRALTNNTDYQVSVVRYFGDGSEEPFFTQEGATNIEFDNWGEVLWVLGEYQFKFNDPTLLTTQTYRGPLYKAARDYVLLPLLTNLEEYPGGDKDGLIVAADTSIWEEHQVDKKHFAFSTAMALQGIGNFTIIADESAPGRYRGDDKETHWSLLNKVGEVSAGFTAAFIRDGKLHGTLEENPKNDIDGALLPVINDLNKLFFGTFFTPQMMKSTAERMEELKVTSGGYERVKSNYTDPAIFEYWYERQEFVFVDLSLAELYRHIGRGAEADKMLERITAKAAANHNIIPEMYVALPCKLFPGKIGDPTGVLPMVGYGAGAYILHLIDRDQGIGNRD
jgi:hypothetical protein